MNYRFFTGALPVFLAAFVGMARADAADDRFHALDGDGDERVSWEEFSATNPNIARRGFDAIDTNKDGYFSHEEWNAFSSNHGMGVPMPGGNTMMPAQDATPPKAPVVPSPAAPSVGMPLVMPPAGPKDAQVVGPQSPVDPGQVSAPVAPDASGRTWDGHMPLVMPPKDGGAPAVGQPKAPDSPSMPLITPPQMPAPASSGAGQ